MGRDKALLPLGGATLAGQVASRVMAAIGNVLLIGWPERYRELGYPVIADQVEGCGPIGGVYTALSVTPADWNLIVACDMPALTVPFLDQLLRRAATSPADCIVPRTPSGLDPLCAVYHRRCLPALSSAIQGKLFKMQDLLSVIRIEAWTVSDPAPLANVNTPQEWKAR